LENAPLQGRLYFGPGLELAVADFLAERVDDPEGDFRPEIRDEKCLLKVVEDAVGVGEVPVGEELVDDGEVLAGLGEAGEELLDVTLGLLLDEAAEAGEEARLAGRGGAA